MTFPLYRVKLVVEDLSPTAPSILVVAHSANVVNEHVQVLFKVGDILDRVDITSLDIPPLGTDRWMRQLG